MKTPERFRLIDWARDQRSGSAGADACLWRMAGRSNSTGKCKMSDAAIANMCGRGERTVTRYLQHLRAAKLIFIHYERGRRVITFAVMPVSRNGGGSTPKRRDGVGQNGGQNPLGGILRSKAQQAEYVRLCSLPPSPERLEALAAFTRGGRDLS